MSKLQLVLIVVIGVELAIGLPRLMVDRPAAEAGPPLPDFSLSDPITEKELNQLAETGKTPEQWAKLGEAYLATGYFPEAEATLRVAAEKGTTATNLFRHAFALERVGRIEDAIQQYEAAANLKGGRQADAWYYVGKNHLRLERTDRAAEAFAKAEPLPAARYELALLHAREGRTQEAHTLLEPLAKNHIHAYTPVGMQYRLAMQTNDPRKLFELSEAFSTRARPLPSPFDSEVDWIMGAANTIGRDGYFLRAGRHAQAGQFHQSEAVLRDALEASWNPEIADKLADVIFAQRRPQEALTILQQAVTEGGPQYELLARLGQAQAAQGNLDQAQITWQRGARLATGPGSLELWQDLAELAKRSQQNDRFQEYTARASFAEGIFELDSGRPADAISHFEAATQRKPDWADAWYFLGVCQHRAGQQTDAVKALEKCLGANPHHGRAKRRLAYLKTAD